MEYEEISELKTGSIIANKFLLEEKLGQGSFGMIFRIINLQTRDSYAIKLEKRSKKHQNMLVREVKVLSELKDEKGFAQLIAYGKTDDYNYVIMSHLGKNLEQLMKKCGDKFSL